MTSERFYVYLQRPDSGEWVTVGRYQATTAADGSSSGEFRYAPNYVEHGADAHATGDAAERRPTTT